MVKKVFSERFIDAFTKAQEVLETWVNKDKGIPKFSSKHDTIVDYMQSQEFREAKPEYQRRIFRQAEEHPQWTLAEARGHSKPTGNTWQIFDDSGLFTEKAEFKSRKEETKYSEYLNAVKKTLESGNDSGLKIWSKKWGKDANRFILKDGTKVKPVTNIHELARLDEFNELPSGAEVYQKGA